MYVSTTFPISLSNLFTAVSNKSKWCPLFGNPEIAIKIDRHKLNFFDVEKHSLKRSEPQVLEEKTFFCIKYLSSNSHYFLKIFENDKGRTRLNGRRTEIC